MKKISLVLTAVGLSASLGAFAAIPTDAQPFHLVVPSLQSGMEFTLEGLLLAPSVGDLNYGSLVTVSTTNGAVSPISTLTQNPNLDMLGFRAAVGYIFESSGNDVQLAWTHMFNDNDTASVALTPQQVLTTEAGAKIGNVGNAGNSYSEFSYKPVSQAQGTLANSYSQTKYDAIDLDVGQYLDIGTRLRLRMFGGLRAAQVENNLSDTYADTLIGTSSAGPDFPVLQYTGSYTEFDQLNSKFSGIGPRFGIDSDYHISNCFGIAGHFAGALLVGEVDSSTTNNINNQLVLNSFDEGGGSNSVNLAGAQAFNASPDDNPVRVVPAFDAKLGLNYSYIFANSSVLSVEAGYQVTEYINALDKIHNTYEFGLPPGAAAGAVPVAVGLPATGLASSTTTTSSIGFDGPYLSFNYKV